jgi:hypothetical protein
VANPNTPFGFRPLIRVGGAPFSCTTYAKPATDTQAIFMGDMVGKVAGAVAMPERPDLNLPTVMSGYATGTFTPGTALWIGVAANYGAASTATPQQVYDEVDCLFLVQGKTGTTYSTNSHVGKNANLSTTTAGSTVTKQSGMTLDGATLQTTNTLDLRTLKISTISPNVEGANAIFEVLINKHEFGQQTAGV